VAGQPVGPVGSGDGAGGVRPHVRAALLLGHAHAGDEPALAGRLGEPELVGGRRQARLVARRQLRGAAQRRHRGVGHRHRTAVAHLDLRPAEVPHGAADVGVPVTRGLRRPRRSGQPVLERRPHQLVPVRMELDLVDPVAVAVVRPESGRVLVGDPAPLLRLLAPGQPAEIGERSQSGCIRVPDAGIGQGGVPRDGVVPDQRRDLVGHLVGRAHPGTVRPPPGSQDAPGRLPDRRHRRPIRPPSEADPVTSPNFVTLRNPPEG
jgi:hypothetical protein